MLRERVRVVVVKDSLGRNGARLTTMMVTYPTSIHEYVLEHRALSRNSLHTPPSLLGRAMGKVGLTSTLLTASHWQGLVGTKLLSKNKTLRRLASEVQAALISSRPVLLKVGEWHLPLVDADEFEVASPETLRLVSASRCKHLGRYKTITEEVGMAYTLLGERPLDMSCFEHQAMAEVEMGTVRGNFKGWRSFRWELEYFYRGDGLSYWDTFKNRGVSCLTIH